MYLSGYSESLSLNYTNNPAESYNPIICKEIGGKQINFDKRDSYNARVAGAIVRYNTQQVLTKLHQNMCKTVLLIENIEKQRQIKVTKTRKSRKTQGKSKKFKGESEQIVITVRNRRNRILHPTWSNNFGKTI